MKVTKMIGATIFVVVNLLSNVVMAESSVWKISKGDSYFYLGGTIHLLSEKDHPLPPEFEEAYQDANKMVFETDVIETQTVQFQAKMMKVMTYGDKRTLSDELSPTVYRKLSVFMSDRHMPISHYAKFQPWAVSLIITLGEYQRIGLKQEFGVDAFFNHRAILDKKEIVGLETADEQLRFLSSLKNVDPNITIDYTLSELHALPEVIHLMKKNWRSGDVNAIENSDDVQRMKNEFPEVYNTLLTKRNNNWMKILPTFSKDKSKEFVLVGAMHLTGEDGLLKQLKARGFNVEQLKSTH
jgi:uncharacterized protein